MWHCSRDRNAADALCLIITDAQKTAHRTERLSDCFRPPGMGWSDRTDRRHDGISDVKALRPRQSCRRTAQRYARLSTACLVLCWCSLADASAVWLGTLAVNRKARARKIERFNRTCLTYQRLARNSVGGQWRTGIPFLSFFEEQFIFISPPPTTFSIYTTGTFYCCLGGLSSPVP